MLYWVRVEIASRIKNCQPYTLNIDVLSMGECIYVDISLCFLSRLPVDF
jgi:hypothetical protein